MSVISNARENMLVKRLVESGWCEVQFATDEKIARMIKASGLPNCQTLSRPFETRDEDGYVRKNTVTLIVDGDKA